jgi:hypothetical protein
MGKPSTWQSRDVGETGTRVRRVHPHRSGSRSAFRPRYLRSADRVHDLVITIDNSTAHLAGALVVFLFGSCCHLRPAGAGSWIATLAPALSPCAPQTYRTRTPRHSTGCSASEGFFRWSATPKTISSPAVPDLALGTGICSSRNQIADQRRLTGYTPMNSTAKLPVTVTSTGTLPVTIFVAVTNTAF